MRQLTLSVVWHATDDHNDGYTLLREMYEPKGVHFHERSGRIDFFRHVMPRLFMPRNLFHWLKLNYVRNADNFKPLLEQIVTESPADFVSFNTDDHVYYRDEFLPEAAFRKLREKPYDFSYRPFVGQNFYESPRILEREDDLLHWDYYDPALQSHWAYPFAVDATFYERSALLDVIHRILYHNPITLESFLFGYVKSRKLFRKGCSPLCSSAVAVPLNKVNYIVAKNKRGNVSVDTLNEFFLNGYHLEYRLPDQVPERSFIPDQVFAVRGDEEVVLPVAHDPEGV